jgi:hypothetical protein
MDTERCASIGAVGLLDALLRRRNPLRQARLVASSAAVDRELAANLELSAMFDTTHQAFVFENAAWLKHSAALREDMLAAEYEAVAVVYRDIPAVETAMERRGPANSIRPDDRALIETWEGNVRVAQRALRDAPKQKPPSAWQLFLARLRGGKKTVP